MHVVLFIPLISSGYRKRCSPLYYYPSVLESEWVRPNESIVGRLCKTASRQAEQRHEEIDAWLRYAKSSIGSQWRAPNTEEASALSKFKCTDQNTRDGPDEYIEPLTGAARHPLAAVCKPSTAKQSVFDITHLILQNACNRSVHPTHKARHLFYDLGASMYEGSIDLQRGFGLGPSVPLFMKLYERNCIDFDHIWAWEYTKFDPVEYWSSVPAHVRGKLHFLNVPVPREPDPNGALALLRATARPDDFVAMKVDVDNSAVEESVVWAIANDPLLAILVDELFFEYHFYGEPQFSFGWGVKNDPSHAYSWTNATVATAVGLMHRLRRRGIRSHFWI